MGDYPNAIFHYYQKAINIDPSFASAYNGFGIVYNNLKEYNNAILYYKKAIDIDPSFASLLVSKYEISTFNRISTTKWKYVDAILLELPSSSLFDLYFPYYDNGNHPNYLFADEMKIISENNLIEEEVNK